MKTIIQFILFAAVSFSVLALFFNNVTVPTPTNYITGTVIQCDYSKGIPTC